jgi:hypothetical protein
MNNKLILRERFTPIARSLQLYVRKKIFVVLLSLIEHVDSCDILRRCFGDFGFGVMLLEDLPNFVWR